MFLLDTDHCVFFIRGHTEVVAAFDVHAEDEPAISIISVGELYFGAMRSARPSENVELCQKLIDRVTLVSLDTQIMLTFARIKKDLFARGEKLEDADLLIAATAIVQGVPLVTHNTSHFARISGLITADWFTK